MENGSRLITPSGHIPANKYTQGYKGLNGSNTVSVLREERANSEIRIPLKGSVFNEFPVFLAQPTLTTPRPTILIHIGTKLYFKITVMPEAKYLATVKNLQP